jgi:hypothetical protein
VVSGCVTGCRKIIYRWHEAFVRGSKLRILIESMRGYDIGSCVVGLMCVREREWSELCFEFDLIREL